MSPDFAQRISRRHALAEAGRISLAATSVSGLLAACGAVARQAAPPAAPTRGTAVPSATAEPTATPDTRPVTVAITGDIMLGRSVASQMLATNDRFPFNGTADYLKGFDITVGNLECVVSTLGTAVPNKTYHFRADPRGFGRLRDAGFQLVSLANNHTGDFGAAAFADMLAQLPDQGIAAVGGGLNRAAAHTPAIRTVRTTTIGFLAYCEVDPFSFAATASSPGHAWLDPALVTADITAVRPHVDFLVVFAHWGIEYQAAQSADQRAMARVAIDAGADVVVGAHPHVIQPYETYNGKLIVYSLGNFVFDEMTSDNVRRGDVLTLTVGGTQLVDWKLRQSYITGDFGQPQWV